MNRYILTHAKMQGEVELGYASSGRLLLWHVRAELNQASYNKLLENIPTDEKHIDYYRKRGFNVKHLPPDLSFDVFWKLYDNKKSRLKAEKLWQKMTTAERMQAIEQIPAYNRFLTSKNMEKAFPDTWLRNKRWQDEY